MLKVCQLLFKSRRTSDEFGQFLWLSLAARREFISNPPSNRLLERGYQQETDEGKLRIGGAY